MSFTPKDFLDACCDAAASSRRPLAMLVVAYVIVFCAIWNARDSCWENSYVIAANAGIAWLGATPEARAAATLGSRLERGRRFVEAYGLDEPDLIKWSIEKVRTSQVENGLFFKLPFFNVSVHINDLSVLAGLAFMLLLLWYRQRLVQHFVCVRLVLSREMEVSDAAAACQLMAMKQLMATPIETHPGGVATTRVTHFLVLVPAIALEGYLLWTNWATRHLAFALGGSYAVPLLLLTGVFFAVIAVVVLDCQRWLSRIARAWSECAEKWWLHPPQAPAAQGCGASREPPEVPRAS